MSAKGGAPESALLSFLSKQNVVNLATHGDGGVHVAPVFYTVIDGGPRLCWLSAPHVLHSQHILADNQMAVSIAPLSTRVVTVTGVQMRGFGSRPTGVDQEGLRAIYLRRFPAARAMLLAKPDSCFWEFTPIWARLVRQQLGVDRGGEWNYEETTG